LFKKRGGLSASRGGFLILGGRKGGKKNLRKEGGIDRLKGRPFCETKNKIAERPRSKKKNGTAIEIRRVREMAKGREISYLHVVERGGFQERGKNLEGEKKEGKKKR